MKISSKKLIHLLKRCLNVLWVVNFVLIPFTLLICTIDFFRDEHLSIPPSFKVPSHSLTQYIPRITDMVQQGDIKIEKVQIYLDGDIKNTPTRFFIFIGMFLLMELFFIPVLFNLRKLFISLDEGYPFTDENVKTLKSIAFFLVVFTPFQILVYPFEYYFIFLSFPTISDFCTNIDFDFWDLFTASIIYIIAEIFNHGLELKKENEEFV